MSHERYAAALIRQRDRIVDGLPFDARDSDVVGDKHTHASWGLCSRDPAAWPDAEDHLWPDQFRHDGRVAPLYRDESQRCPMQTRGGGAGCFYSCRIFTHGTVDASRRDEAIRLYDEAVQRERGEAVEGAE